MKKLLAIILSLVLALSMFAVSASAAPGGTITLNNTMTSVSINGRSFNAYRIFDVTTDGAGHYAYTFANASVQAYFAAKLPSITTGAGAVAYIEALDNNTTQTSAEEFAIEIYAAIQAATIAPPLTTATGVGAQAVFTGLDMGYFLVYDATTGSPITKSACILTTNDNNIVINLKWEIPTIIEKITNGIDGTNPTDATSAADGAVIDIQHTSKVPDMTGYTNYTFEILDQLTDLTLEPGWEANLVITIGGVTIDPSDYTVVTAPDGHSYTIVFDNFIQYKDQLGEPIVITFPATYTPSSDTAVGDSLVTLTYSNNPLAPTSTATAQDDVKVYCFKVVITKVDGQDNGIKLAGATFELYRFEGGSYVLKQTLTTDATGIITYGKLSSGQYRLVETVAPAGYNLLTAPIDFTITAAFTGTSLSTLTCSNPEFAANAGTASISSTVENNGGNILPGTGGIGVTVFYVTGLTLMIVAAAFFIYRKKKVEAN